MLPTGCFKGLKPVTMWNAGMQSFGHPFNFSSSVRLSLLTKVNQWFSLKMILIWGDLRRRVGDRGERLGINMVLMVWLWSVWNLIHCHPFMFPSIKTLSWILQHGILNIEHWLVLKTVCVWTWNKTPCKLFLLMSLERCDLFDWSRGRRIQDRKTGELTHPIHVSFKRTRFFKAAS